jgi:hypothetical protein
MKLQMYDFLAVSAIFLLHGVSGRQINSTNPYQADARSR